jgi:hypothetical protein
VGRLAAPVDRIKSIKINVPGSLYNGDKNKGEDRMITFKIENRQGVFSEIESPREKFEQNLDFLLNYYYKGYITRLWIDDVEWMEPCN